MSYPSLARDRVAYPFPYQKSGQCSHTVRAVVVGCNTPVVVVGGRAIVGLGRKESRSHKESRSCCLASLVCRLAVEDCWDPSKAAQEVEHN